MTKMSKEEAKLLGELGAGQAVGEDKRGYYVRFSVPKNNYGEPIPDRWFKRDQGGVLLPIELTSAKQDREPQSKRRGATERPEHHDEAEWGVKFQ